MPSYTLPGGTIKFESEKTNGRHVAVAASGGGGIEGLSVSLLDGSAAHGNRVRIEADASYAVGSKAQAAPRHWQMGSDVRLDGAPVSGETVGGSPDTANIWEGADANVEVADTYLRHANVDLTYKIKHVGDLAASRPFSNIGPTEGAKYYQAFWVYPGHTYSSTRFYTVTGVSGSFSVDPDLRRGEKITIDTSTASNQTNITRTTGEAYLINLSNGYLTYEQIDDMGNNTELAGSTITGNTSGATATLDAYQASPASVKAFRHKQESTTSPGVRITLSYLSEGQFFVISRDSNGNNVSAPDPTYVSEYIAGPDPDTAPMEWHFVELVVDFSGSSGRVYVYTDGTLRYSKEDYPLDYVSSVNGNRLSTAGLDTPGTASVNELGMMMEIGEWYMDNDTRRLYLCDANTLSGSSVLELQYPEAWSEDGEGAVTIDAELYQGAHSGVSGKYLALVENNTVIFEGLEVPA